MEAAKLQYRRLMPRSCGHGLASVSMLWPMFCLASIRGFRAIQINFVVVANSYCCKNYCVDWLQSIPGDSRNARCGFCQVVLPAHHAGLCRHAQDPKHVKRVVEGNLTSKSQSHPVEHGSMSNQDKSERSDGLVRSVTIMF